MDSLTCNYVVGISHLKFNISCILLRSRTLQNLDQFHTRHQSSYLPCPHQQRPPRLHNFSFFVRTQLLQDAIAILVDPSFCTKRLLARSQKISHHHSQFLKKPLHAHLLIGAANQLGSPMAGLQTVGPSLLSLSSWLPVERGGHSIAKTHTSVSIKLLQVQGHLIPTSKLAVFVRSF